MQLNKICVGGDSSFKVACEIDRDRLNKIEKNLFIICFFNNHNYVMMYVFSWDFEMSLSFNHIN